MCSLCRLPVAKNYNFGQILTFLGAPVSTAFYRCGPNLVCYSRPTAYAYMPNFISIGLYCHPLAAKNWTSAFNGVASWHQSEKVQHNAQLQTFPYPTVLESFLYSNAFMAKSGAQSLTFKSVTDRQTEKQTNKQKTQRLWLSWRRVKSEPHQTWHGDRGPRARSCTWNTFGGLTHSSPLGGAENLGTTRPRRLKTV